MTNEKRLLERAGLRGVDDIIGSLSTESGAESDADPGAESGAESGAASGANPLLRAIAATQTLLERTGPQSGGSATDAE